MGYRRRVSIALNNTGFKHARLETKVSFEEPLQIEKPTQMKEAKVPMPELP